MALAVLAVIVVCCVFMGVHGNNEAFSRVFTEAKASNEFLQYLDQGDHRTMVRQLRGDNGSTVLLLHNNPATQTLWNPLFQTMQRFSMAGAKIPNLVAYDIRGHGTAWMPVDPKYNDLDINNYAWPGDLFVKDCKNVYDKIIGDGKIIIVGFGFGGYVAQKFALTYGDLIEKLVILQTTITPNPEINTQINYLGGPNGWIARNPGISYLTMEERFVGDMLCSWFYLPHDKKCPEDRLIDENDHGVNDSTSPQYNLAAMMWRQGSATTTLQTDKVNVADNLISEWSKGGLEYPVHILAGTDDPSATPAMMTKTFTTIQHANRHLTVVLDVVNGRHGFTVMRPDYIAEIICGDCRKLVKRGTFTTTSL